MASLKFHHRPEAVGEIIGEKVLRSGPLDSGDGAGVPTDLASIDALVCPTAAQVPCHDRCVDPSSDPSNCGACDRACPSGAQCVDRTCRAICAPPRSMCEGACVDPQTDASNCGSCGRRCPAPTGGAAACVAGNCQQVCPAGRQNCGGICVASGPCTSAGTGGCQQTGTLMCLGTSPVCSASPRNGGACSSPAGGICVAGTCRCQNGLCDGRCNSLLEPANCGRCGNVCPTGYPLCHEFRCSQSPVTCPSGTCPLVCPSPSQCASNGPSCRCRLPLP